MSDQPPRRVPVGVIIAAVALVAVAVLVVVKVRAQPDVEPDVVVVGDSLTLQAQMAGGLGKRLEERGYANDVDAEMGRRTLAGIPIVDDATRDRKRGTLIIALGTNDRPPADTFRKVVDRMMQATRGWPTYWMEVESGPGEPLNAVLRDAALRYPNLHLVSFAPVVARHPEYRSSDGIHLTDAGSAARARFVAELLPARRD